LSAMLTIVLLKEARMWTTPSDSTTRLLRFARGAAAFFAPCVFVDNALSSQSQALLLRSLLLSGDGTSLPLVSTRIRARALPANGETATMTNSAIAADVHETLDVH